MRTKFTNCKKGHSSQDVLYAAFAAGFSYSAEGWNGEYGTDRLLPMDLEVETFEEWLDGKFHEWLGWSKS